MTNQVNTHSLIPSIDVIQLTLTLTMTTAQVVETSVTVNISPVQDYIYIHLDNHVKPTCPYTVELSLISIKKNHLTFLQQASHNHLSSIQTMGDQKIVKVGVLGIHHSVTFIQISLTKFPRI